MFPGNGDFEFELKKFPVLKFFPVLETLSLSEKYHLLGFSPVLGRNDGHPKLKKH